MSVINKMLRDLDKRGGLGPRTLEEEIRGNERVAPAHAAVVAPRPWGRISALVIVVGLLGAGAWYAFRQPSPPTVAAVKSAPPAKPIPAPTPLSPPQAATSAAPATPPLTATQPAADPVIARGPDAKSEVVSAVAAVGSPPAATPKAEVIAKATVETTKAEPKVPSSASPPPPAPTPSTKAEVMSPPAMKALASESVAKMSVASERVSGAVESARTNAPPQPAPRPVAAAEPPRKSPDDDTRVSIERPDRLTGAPRALAEFRSANDLLAQGRVEAALARYADALRSDPRHVPARQSMVVLLLDQGRVADAQAALREGVAAVPQNTAWSMLLARLQVESGDTRSALETLERVLPHAQGQGEYHAFLATLLQMQSRHREAIVHYEASLRALPESARSLVGLAISLEEERRPAEARDAYRRAISAGGLPKQLETFVERKVLQLQ